jgi:hypothetical protein
MGYKIKNLKDTKALAFALPGAGTFGSDGIDTAIYKYLNNLLLPLLVGVGLKYIMAEGDAGKTTEARKIILTAVIGIILIATSAVIINWVSSFWNEVLP